MKKCLESLRIIDPEFNDEAILATLDCSRDGKHEQRVNGIPGDGEHRALIPVKRRGKTFELQVSWTYVDPGARQRR